MSKSIPQGSGFSSPQTIARFGAYEIRHAGEGVEVVPRPSKGRGVRLLVGAALGAAGAAVLSGTVDAEQGLGVFLLLAGGIVALSGISRGPGTRPLVITGTDLIVGSPDAADAQRRPLSDAARVIVQTMTTPRRKGRSMRNNKFFKVAIEDHNGRVMGPLFQPLLHEAARGLAAELARRTGVGVADDFERTTA